MEEGRDTKANISHMFLGSESLLGETEEVNFSLDIDNESIVYIRGPGSYEEIAVHHVTDVHSFQFCFFEKGPLSSSEFTGAMVLRFVRPVKLFKKRIVHRTKQRRPAEPSKEQIVNRTDELMLVLKGTLANFLQFKQFVDRYTQFFSQKAIVKVSSFPQFPQFVKDILPRVKHMATRQVLSRIKREKSIVAFDQSQSIVTIYDSFSPRGSPLPTVSEDQASSQSNFYDIGGESFQISEDGIASLTHGFYINDEIINLGLGRVQGLFPNVHIFDTYTSAKIFTAFQNRTYDQNCTMSYNDFNRHFGSYFFKKDEPRDLSETFMRKKVLIFPVNHLQHWFLVVVTNPLLADNMTGADSEKKEGERASAYFIDSLKDTPNYPNSILELRLEATWPPIFTFLRLAAYHHGFCYFNPITCIYHNNIPSQDNDSDCGPHSIVNAHLVAELYEDLLMGPNALVISSEKQAEVKDKATRFRTDFTKYLESCKM